MIRPATRADIDKYYPGFGVSFRAWVGEVAGEARGIAGIAYTRPYASLFSKFDEDYRPWLRRFAVWRLIRNIAAVVRASRFPVLACAEPGEATAPALLAKIGMKRIGEVSGVDLYEWRPTI